MKIELSSEQAQNLLTILIETRDEYTDDVRRARTGSQAKAHWMRRVSQCAELEDILNAALKITPKRIAP
jgi:hypothetical protein